MMMLRPAVRIALSVAVVCACASIASAQGRPGGGRGFGGGFGFGGKTSLVGNEQVQTELKITDDQKTKLAEVTKKYREDSAALFPRDQNLSREERQKKFEETADARKKLATDADAKIDEILTSDQKKRLDEIVLQQQGNRALTSDKVVTALGITAEQKTKLETIQKEQAEKQRALFTGGEGGRPDFAANREKMEKLREETNTAIAGVLTAEQKTKWEGMKGKEFRLNFGQGGGSRRPRNNNN